MRLKLFLLPLLTISFLNTTCAQVEEPKELSICSFNIQFLGNFKNRNDSALADLVKAYDIVVIQELVAPPVSGIYPNGDAYAADMEAERFMECMTQNGFQFVLSDEDTGTGKDIHKYSAATEWWIAFYKADKVNPVKELPSGFLAEDRSDHPDFERVPYAFSFETKDENYDFVLISVHLKPDKNGYLRRKQELNAIYNWIDIADSIEKDFFILGDMNIYNSVELDSLLIPEYRSLNEACGITTTNTNNGGKPYDHVFYRPEFSSTELQKELQIINLVDTMDYYWKDTIAYPGKPYIHNVFRTRFSDHNPILFYLNYGLDKD